MRTYIRRFGLSAFLKLLVFLLGTNLARADYSFTTLSGSITLSSPNGIAVSSGSDVYVAESATHAIRKISRFGDWTTFAGLPGTAGSTDDAIGANARFDFPQGLAVDSNGNLFVADTGNNTIRRITPAGVVTTFAGTPGGGGGSGGGSADGTGAAAAFHLPYGIAVDNGGNVFVADTFNHTIRKITSDGVTTTIAGSAGSSGNTDGVGSTARFSFPRGLAVDASGNIFVADSANHTIRKITTNGTVTTLAGTAGAFGSLNGTGSAARFASPHGVATDSAGNVYVADTFNNSVRKITPDGVVSTVAGGSAPGTVDGNGSVARFNAPDSLALNSQGNIYVADTGNNAIRRGINLSHSTSFSSDFNDDGFSDVVFQNSVTGERFVWLISATGHIGGASLGIVGTDWSIVGTADFNADGHADVLWQNGMTGERFLWFMLGVGHVGGTSVGVVSTEWTIAATNDFNGDGSADILWQNTVTGERYVWFMSGAGHIGGASLGIVPTDWSIGDAADFNGDGQTDILWQNTVTGERYIWYMSGAGHISGVGLGVVATAWSIVAANDFNNDGRPDILWQNTVTGQRYIWLMDGVAHQSDIDLGIVDTNWKIAK